MNRILDSATVLHALLSEGSRAHMTQLFCHTPRGRNLFLCAQIDLDRATSGTNKVGRSRYCWPFRPCQARQFVWRRRAVGKYVEVRVDMKDDAATATLPIEVCYTALRCPPSVFGFAKRARGAYVVFAVGPWLLMSVGLSTA